MDDLKCRIIHEVLVRMAGILDKEQEQQLETTLFIELNEYDVSERCTDLVKIDDKPFALLRRFIATKRLEGRSENTILQYQLHLGKMIIAISKDLDKITTYDIRFYLADYKEKRKVSNLTLDNMRRCISSFFNWLNNEGYIRRNPSAAVKKISYEKTVKKPYSHEELEKLRWKCDNLRDLAMVEFLYASGCRVSEVAALNINDIDFISRTAIVLGKGNKQRTIYLTESAALHLNNYLIDRKDCNPALFVSLKSPYKRIGKNGIEAMLRRLGQSAGISKVHPHRYRRTLATNMLDRGAHIQDVQKILGHEDIRTTEIYCYVTDSNIRYAYNKFAG